MSPWLSHMSPRHAVPTNALRVACVVPIIIRLYVYVDAGQLPRVTAFAVLGICIAFQAVVLDALRQWPKGWRPAGNWNLGSAGMLVNVIALAYGIMAIFLLLKRGETGSVLDDWVVAIGLVVVMGTGQPTGSRRGSAPDNALRSATMLIVHPRTSKAPARVAAGQGPHRLSQHRARPKGFEPLTF